MTDEQILKSAQALFGEDIVKNAYAKDLSQLDKGNDKVNEDELHVVGLEIIIEFTNGKSIELWSVEGGGIAREGYYK